MYRFHRQFDYGFKRNPNGRLSMNFVVLLMAIGAFDVGVSLLSWLMQIRRSGSAGYFLELCFAVSMVASLMLILVPAFHLQRLRHKMRTGAASGGRPSQDCIGLCPSGFPHSQA